MSRPLDHFRFTGGLCIAGTLLGWSSVLLFLKVLTGHIDGYTANGWRYGMSALMWLPVLLIGYVRRDLPHGLWRRAFVPALFNLLGQLCYGLAPYHIGPGLTGFLVRLSVVSSMIGAFILFADERVLLRSPAFWFGLCLVIFGSGGTIFFHERLHDPGAAKGIILAAVSGIFYGMYSISVRYYMRGIGSMVSFAAIALYTALGLVVVMFIYGESHGLGVLRLSAYGWFILVVSAFVGIAVGHVFYYAAIARMGVAISNGILQTAPFLTAVGSYLLFNEVLSGVQWACGVIILAGALVLLWSEQTRQKALRLVAAGVPALPIDAPPPVVPATEPAITTTR